MLIITILFAVAFIAAFLLTQRSTKKSSSSFSTLEDKEEKAETSLADLGYEVEKSSPKLASSDNFQVGSPHDLILFYLTAPTTRPFLGYELVQALLSANLRLGSLNLFHRYDEQGKILFSVSQANQTGGFDLDQIGEINCRGLILFMQPHPDTAQFVLEDLLNTAYELAEELDGQLEDAKHQPLNEQTLTHYRERCALATEI